MQNFPKKVARLLAVSALTAAALGATTTAHAEHTAKPKPHTATTKPHPKIQAGCPRDGRLGPNYVCTSLSNGAVFHNKMDDGNSIAIHSSYEKRGGGQITAKLGYSHRGSERWGGWHDYSSGQSRSEEDRNYDLAFLCEPTIGLLKVDGQGTFQTPVASC